MAEVLEELDDKSLTVQLSTLTYVSESLLAINSKEGLSLDPREIKDLNIAKEASGVVNIAIDVTKSAARLAWKAVKTIVKALLKVTLAIHELGVNLANKLETLSKSRRKRLMRLNAWFKGGGNRKVRTYIKDAVKYDKKIGDMKSFAYYIDSTDQPGRWKGKFGTFALAGNKVANDWGAAIRANEQTLKDLLDDHGKLLDIYIKLHAIEEENEKLNRNLFKKHYHKPHQGAEAEAREFRDGQKKTLREQVLGVIDTIGDDISSGVFTIDEKMATYKAHPLHSTTIKKALQIPMIIPVLDGVFPYVDKFAIRQKEIRRAQRAVLDSDRRISEKTHNTKFARLMIQESQQSSMFMYKIYVTLMKAYKDMSRLYLKIFKAHIKTGTKIYNVEYSIKVTRFSDHVLEPVANRIAKAPGSFGNNKLRNKRKL